MAELNAGIRKTPAQRHIVTCGGQLRSKGNSALGMPSVVLDFAMGCRCQVVGNSLQPGGVMRTSILHLVDNERILRLTDRRVNARRSTREQIGAASSGTI
jgi:hypothetical protein